MNWTKVGGNALFAAGILLAILRILWLPLSWILSFLAKVLLIITTPIQWIARAIFHSIAVPARFLARFETLFYYLGSACIIGLLAGTGLYYTTRILFQVFDMYDQPGGPESKASMGRTAASYRAERLQKQADEALDSIGAPLLAVRPESEAKAAPAAAVAAHSWGLGAEIARFPLGSALEKKGLLSTTIFEEEDSSDYTTM